MRLMSLCALTISSVITSWSNISITQSFPPKRALIRLDVAPTRSSPRQHFDIISLIYKIGGKKSKQQTLNSSWLRAMILNNINVPFLFLETISWRCLCRSGGKQMDWVIWNVTRSEETCGGAGEEAEREKDKSGPKLKYVLGRFCCE